GDEPYSNGSAVGAHGCRIGKEQYHAQCCREALSPFVPALPPELKPICSRPPLISNAFPRKSYGSFHFALPCWQRIRRLSWFDNALEDMYSLRFPGDGHR